MKNILVVEDDSALQSALTRSLKGLRDPVNITWVTSVDDATAAVEKGSFDLIVSDYFLPGLRTGMDLWNHCGRHCPRVPFIMISGMAVSEYLGLPWENRLVPRFLSKPFSPSEFIEAVTASWPLRVIVRAKAA